MTADVPFNDPDNGSTPQPQGFDPAQIAELAQAFQDLQFRDQHIEPVLRDFNRNAAELFGQCPNTPSGNWATIDESGNVTVHMLLEDIVRVSSVIASVLSKVEAAEVRRALPKHGGFTQYLQHMAQLSWERRSATKAESTSVHLKPAKGRGFFRKGK